MAKSKQTLFCAQQSCYVCLALKQHSRNLQPGASISGLSYRTKLQGGGGFCKQAWLQKLDQLLRKLSFTEQCVAMGVGYSPRNRSLSSTVSRNLTEKQFLVTKWSWAGFSSPTSVVLCVPLKSLTGNFHF